MSHILATGQKITLTYDQRGQLTRAALSGGRVITYTIDGEGRRLSRFVDAVFNTGYMHDTSGRLVAEIEPSGQLRSHFVYATESHSPDYMIKGGIRYYLAKDQLGSMRAVINADTGAVAQAIHYDEFGRILSDSNPGFQPFGFAGGHYDFETGLVRFGARDYDSEIGRWLSKDPILFAGGDANLYGYVLNQPISLIDPDGQSPVLVGAAIGAFLGALLTPTPIETPISPAEEAARVAAGAGAGALLGGVAGAACSIAAAPNANRYIRIGEGKFPEPYSKRISIGNTPGRKIEIGMSPQGKIDLKVGPQRMTLRPPDK